MSDRLDRYLAREAFDYLEQVEAALSGAHTPDPSTLRRLSGGVRGSARMAGMHGVEAVAGRMEAELQRVVEGGREWNGAFAELAKRTVADLRALVGAGERWSTAEDDRARVAIARWDVMTGVEEGTADTVPIEALFPDDGGMNVLSGGDASGVGAPADDSDVVPIEKLLLDRSDALRMARAMRADLERAVQALPASRETVLASLVELYELMEIAARGDLRGG